MNQPFDPVYLSDEVRPQAVYIAGNPGYGKSSLLQQMALQDIKAMPKRGVCVIDPTGDLVTKLIHWIPEHRAEDTIWFDTNDPVPIDFFSYRDHDERTVLTDQLLNIFHLENAPISRPRLMKIFVTLFDANDNPNLPDKYRATFLDVQSFIEDKNRREQILHYCPQNKPHWPEHVFAKMADFSPIVERMGPFFFTPALRTMLSAKRPKLNIADVMRENQILLVNLKDTPTDFFIGALIASKFQQATFGRRYLPEPDRVPYYLYVDECNTLLEYSAKDFESILVRARKYRLCLTLANQIPDDLPEGIRRKLGTIETHILFKLDVTNARLFENLIAPLDIRDLVNLPKFQAVYRCGDQVGKIPNTLSYLDRSPVSYAEIIKKRTVEKYSCDTGTAMLELEQHGSRNDEDDDIKPTGRPKSAASLQRKE